MFYKGGGKTEFVPKEGYVVGGTSEQWLTTCPRFRATGPKKVPYLVGGWLKPYSLEVGYSAPDTQIINQDLDGSSTSGYSTLRYSIVSNPNDTTTFTTQSYQYGGNTSEAYTFPAVSDKQQWFFVMVAVLSDATSRWCINGKKAQDLVANQNGPWVNGANDLVSYQFTRRYAGSSALNRTYEGWLHNYFICDLDDYTNIFKDRGVVEGDWDTYINPWATNKQGKYLDPITDEEDPERKSLLVSTDKGAQMWVSNTNFMNETGSGFTFWNSDIGSKTLTQMPIYGYDLRGI